MSVDLGWVDTDFNVAKPLVIVGPHVTSWRGFQVEPCQGNRTLVFLLFSTSSLRNTKNNSNANLSLYSMPLRTFTPLPGVFEVLVTHSHQLLVGLSCKCGRLLLLEAFLGVMSLCHLWTVLSTGVFFSLACLCFAGQSPERPDWTRLLPSSQSVALLPSSAASGLWEGLSFPYGNGLLAHTCVGRTSRMCGLLTILSPAFPLLFLLSVWVPTSNRSGLLWKIVFLKVHCKLYFL